MTDRKSHWDSIFTHKEPHEVSWTQEKPQTSLDLIDSFMLPRTASIIDVGGGDSRLVDFLLEKGYENITVLDISEKALNRAKLRLGEKAFRVKWIVSDITEFQPDQQFDIWHDRAAFHFLTTEEQIHSYLKTARKAVGQFMVIGTFSNEGPLKCSGLEIKQYSERTMEEQFAENFRKIGAITEDHITPFQTKQNFLFCNFAVRHFKA